MFKIMLLACTQPQMDDTQIEESDPPMGVACPSWSGLEAGAARSYDTPEAKRDELGYRYQYTVAVGEPEHDADSSTYTVTQQATQTGGGWDSYSATQALRYRCDADGAWYLGLRTDWEGVVSGGSADSGWSTADFEGYLWLPHTMDAPWTADWTGHFEDDSGTTVDDARSYTFTPQDVESVTVPAGTFEAQRVERTGSATPTALEWYAEGLVQTETIERVQ